MNRIEIEIKGIEPEQQGYVSVRLLANVFEEALNIAAIKSQAYGNAWRQQGWMGNLARVMSKTSRLKNMLWRDMAFSSSTEPVEETVLDQINILGFMHINLRDRNRWGAGE